VRTSLALIGLCGLLCGCGSDKSTTEWLDQLRAPEASARLRALKALEERRGEADVIIPALTGLLRDKDAFVRRDAARALGKMGPGAKAASPALLLLLEDQNGGVRKAAGQALKNIDPEAAARSGAQ
jgi:HEAT repeat protein